MQKFALFLSNFRYIFRGNVKINIFQKLNFTSKIIELNTYFLIIILINFLGMFIPFSLIRIVNRARQETSYLRAINGYEVRT